MPRSELLAEMLKVQANPPTEIIPSLRRTLFKQQADFLNDNAHPMRSACCSRRAGKTQGIIRGLLLRCAEYPKSVCVYFATTLASARKITWDSPDGIPNLIAEHNLHALCEVSESEHRVKFKNGSVLWVAGCETLPDARKWKGLRYDIANIDEAQDWPEEIIKYMVDTALSPALMDRRGELLITGTPGPVEAGLFYDATSGTTSEWGRHGWTCFQNPHISNPQKFVEETCQRRGLTTDDPIIQREFFGRWVRDVNTLLFHYQPGRNDYHALPSAPEWRYIVGMDVGVRDLSTFVVCAFRQYDPTVYITEVYGMNGNDVTAWCEMAKSYKAKYPTAQFFMDQGGLGKGYALELLSRHQMVAHPATKTDKAGYIRLLNDQLRLGRIKAGPTCKALTDQWSKLQYDPKTQIEKPTQACDYADAALYGWRACWAFLAQPEPDLSTQAQLSARVKQALEQRRPQKDRDLALEREAMLYREPL